MATMQRYRYRADVEIMYETPEDNPEKARRELQRFLEETKRLKGMEATVLKISAGRHVFEE